jgi:mRNA-degrading endonuclease toxin of MazEF toxin-antitoxin module
MAADELREREATEWSESLIGDVADETRLYPSEAYVTLQGEQRKAMADQIATVAKERLSSRIGQVTSADLVGVERAIKVQLGL